MDTAERQIWVRERGGIIVCQRTLNWRCLLLSLWKWCLWVKDLEVLTQGFNSSRTIQEEPWNQICFLLKATKEAQGHAQSIYCYCVPTWETHFLFHCRQRGTMSHLDLVLLYYNTLFVVINEYKNVRGTHSDHFSISFSHYSYFYILFCFVVTRLLLFVVISTFLWSMCLIRGCKT